MIKKIDNFCNRFLKWKVIRNILLAELFNIPWAFFMSFYNIPTLFNIIMVFSIGFTITFFQKAIRHIIEEES